MIWWQARSRVSCPIANLRSSYSSYDKQECNVPKGELVIQIGLPSVTLSLWFWSTAVIPKPTLLFCWILRAPQCARERRLHEHDALPQLFKRTGFNCGNVETMPIKFKKEVSTHLFKYVRTIDIKFNRKFASML